MVAKRSNAPLKFIAAFSFLIMITMNILANALPINGLNTGQVSDSYPNLFAPAGLTFAIWGLIYLLLFGYILYQFAASQPEQSEEKANSLNKIRLYFIISSLANAAWILTWHYRLIPLSMLLMLVILFCLILIAQEIGKLSLSTAEKFFIKLPFSVYFGWITVATIANATVLLVSLGFRGFGMPESIWTVIVLIVGLLIGSATILSKNDFTYGLVILWAYAGILNKHLSYDGFNGQYQGIINTVIVCIVLLFLVQAYVLILGKRQG